MNFVIINSVCKESSTGSIAYELYKFLKSNGHNAKVCFGR